MLPSQIATVVEEDVDELEVVLVLDVEVVDVDEVVIVEDEELEEEEELVDEELDELVVVLRHVDCRR